MSNNNYSKDNNNVDSQSDVNCTTHKLNLNKHKQRDCRSDTNHNSISSQFSNSNNSNININHNRTCSKSIDANSGKSADRSTGTSNDRVKNQLKNEDKLENKSRPYRRYGSYRNRYDSHSCKYESRLRHNETSQSDSKDHKRHDNDSKNDKDLVKTSNDEQKHNQSSDCQTNDSNFSQIEDISWTGDKKSNKSNNCNNIQLQLDEITALKSIFDDKVLTIDESQLKGRFLIEPVLSATPYSVVYLDTTLENPTEEHFSIENLPPIELYFELPEEYPSESHPMFLISCKWLTLPDLDLICGKLEELWKESKMEVLYTWFSFLQNELMSWFNYSDKLDITPIINLKPKPITKPETDSKPTDPNSTNNSDLPTVSKLTASRSRASNWRARNVMEFKPELDRGVAKYDRRAVCDQIGADLINHLKAYNSFKKKEIFNKSYVQCNICFSESMGQDTVVFPCLHMNCKKCIRDYFTTLVTDGSVHLLKCPEPKCDTSAPPNLVRELISEELFKKYDELLLASVIGSMNDVYYCPRKVCGSVVIAESDSNLAHCSSCRYAFCKNCKFTYHGLDPCQIFRNSAEREQILDRYNNATGEEKLRLEKIYGKKQLTAALEEAATQKWMNEMSKRCPHCKASIEKSEGCNKMSCWRCNTYFCWLCLQQLSPTQPYSHFNNPESKCFNQLFHGVQIDDVFDHINF